METEDITRLVEPGYISYIPNPYYSEDHRAFQKTFREYLESHVVQKLDEWTENKVYPFHIHTAFYEMGVQSAVFRFGPEYGAAKQNRYDSFHELIVWSELARVSLNSVSFMLGIDSMAVPPILKYGNEEMKRRILPRLIDGSIHVALAISESTAGSDIAAIQTTAIKSSDGRSYIINGTKKWISGANVCSYFTCCVRTRDTGATGLSVIVIPSDTKGISIRKMNMQFDSVMWTAFVTFENVIVPVENLLGNENDGFRMIVENFNHERFVISTSATACARRCFELSLRHAMKRKTFNKTMIQHQVIRYKLAEMARIIEAMQAQVEQVAYILDHKNEKVQEKAIGEISALTKVNCTKGLEFCAREASQIFGGSSLVREGIGKEVEGFYRNVRSHAIPGGSEEILLDLAIRSITNLKQSKL
jgi:alkylation response protein AidB-like acyl-CoA dehydrogenase